MRDRSLDTEARKRERGLKLRIFGGERLLGLSTQHKEEGKGKRTLSTILVKAWKLNSDCVQTRGTGAKLAAA